MPEYPDIVIYIERLESLLVGYPLQQVRFTSPFLLRTAEPPIHDIKGRVVHGFKQLGKRIVCNAYGMPAMKPTIARNARPAANCWQIVLYPDC